MEMLKVIVILYNNNIYNYIIYLGTIDKICSDATDKLYHQFEMNPKIPEFSANNENLFKYLFENKRYYLKASDNKEVLKISKDQL